MKIAVCLSGQPRTWRKCYKSWFNLFQSITDQPVDFFYHTWDFNTLPQIINDHDYQTVPREELEEMHSVLGPKKFLIESHPQSMWSIDYLKSINYPHSGGTPVTWAGSQFYSLMRSSFLKKQYEVENHFQYDICFRLRTDLYWGTFAIEHFRDNFEMPEPNTIYSCHNGPANVFPWVRIGDIFYYSDSTTFDKLGEFYRWLPVIGTIAFGNDDNPPEIPWTFFIKMLRIQNRRKTFDPKVMRTDEYAVKKMSQGMGMLGGHELT